MSRELKVAIQGGLASFHEMATQQFFRDHAYSLHCCRSFRQLCDALVQERVDFGVMAIENSVAGGILANYSLLRDRPLRIVGETYLQVHQHLLALPGQTLAQIRQVRSHPMALLQCSEFLAAHPHLMCSETHDTAESAREIRERGLRGVAAIAGTLAAERYGLTTVVRNIENEKENYTRFLVLQKGAPEVTAAGNKASLSFQVRHEVGALAAALDVLRREGLNLDLIQSLPIPGQPHRYSFHVDVEWPQGGRFEAALAALSKTTLELRLLGIYEAAPSPWNESQKQ